MMNCWGISLLISASENKMNIKFIFRQNLVANKFFDIVDDNIYIRSVEGSGNKNGEFITVIKIDPKYYGREIGFLAFEKMFILINQNYPVVTIKASWHKNDEFKNFEHGMSTNLLLFKKNLSTH